MPVTACRSRIGHLLRVEPRAQLAHQVAPRPDAAVWLQRQQHATRARRRAPVVVVLVVGQVRQHRAGDVELLEFLDDRAGVVVEGLDQVELVLADPEAWRAVAELERVGAAHHVAQRVFLAIDASLRAQMVVVRDPVRPFRLVRRAAGAGAFSRMMTCAPARVAAMAADKPAAPVPTTTTSAVCVQLRVVAASAVREAVAAKVAAAALPRRPAGKIVTRIHS